MTRLSRDLLHLTPCVAGADGEPPAPFLQSMKEGLPKVLFNPEEKPT